MKPKLKPIKNQVVVLAGATSGIGLETAFHMVEKGAQVVIVGRNQEGLNEAVDRVRAHAQASRLTRGNGGYLPRAHGGAIVAEGTDVVSAESGGAPYMTEEEQVMGLEADITNFEQIRGVAEQVMQRMGRIDTWVNVAAVSEWALFEDTSPDEFRRIIDVNLVGQAYGAMAALPYLKQQQGGALIFVSSMAGKVPVPYQSAYNASKHGLVGLAETLRMEMQHTGVPISVTAILPSSINTPLFDKARTKLGVEPDPMRPIYDTKLAARAITHAATHPVRELIVGDAGYVMTFIRRLSPALSNRYMSAAGFRQQHSNQPKSAQAPDNLYQHISGYESAEGEYTHNVSRFSPLTWLSIHPRVRMAIYGSILTGLGLLAGTRILEARRRRRSWRYQLPRQARKAYHQFNKSAGKALSNTGSTIMALPILSRIPMFQHRPSFFERVGSAVSGFLAAAISVLPFINRRKSVGQRLRDSVAKVDSLTMADRRRKAVKRIASGSEKVIEKVNEQRKDVMNTVSKRMPSKRDLKQMAEKATRPKLVRKQSLIERLPFGTRRETVLEKIDMKK